MAIYRTGQASMDADGYITGYGTKWKTALTLIRPGATIVFASNPVAYATISEIVNDTSLRATSTGGAVVPRGDYVILLHDSITVDGLAQDVAETLRYYQGQETMYEQFVEFLKGFDWQRMEQLGEKVYADSKAAEASANAAKASETNANASKNAAAASASAAKTSETNAKASETSATASKNAAKTSEDNAAASKNAAASSASAAAGSATSASNSAATAKSEADRAADLAKQLDATSLMRKDANLSDVTNKASARENLQVDRLVQGSTSTTVGKSGGNRLAVNDSGEWGALDSSSNWIALAVNKGGTGAKDAAGARANLHVFQQRKSALSASDNLNDIRGYTMTGYYHCAGNVVATPENNYPIKQAGVLLVTSSQANGVDQTTQEYFPFALPTTKYVRAYNRHDNNWSWSKWTRVSWASGDWLASVWDATGEGTYRIKGDGTDSPTTGAPTGSGNNILNLVVSEAYTNAWLLFAYTGGQGMWFGRFNPQDKNSQPVWTKVAQEGGSPEFYSLKTRSGIEAYLNSDSDTPAPSIVSRRSNAAGKTIVSSEMRANNNGSVEWIKRDSGGSPRSIQITSANEVQFNSLVPVPASIEVGKANANSAAYIDFHYGAKYDYDARIICDGMNSDQAGGGNLRFYAGYINMNAKSSYSFTGGRFTVSTSDVNIDSQMWVKKDGSPIVLQNKTTGYANYILAKDVSSGDQWHVGRGGNNNDMVSLHNYKFNTAVQLRQTDVYVNRDFTSQGNMVCNGSSIYVDGGSGTSNTHLWLRNSSKKNRAVIYSSDTQVLQLRSDNAGTGAGGQALSVYGATGECKAVKFTATSDERAKFWIKPVTGALDKICSLRGVTYSMHTTIQNTVRNAGVIAQDVQKVLPEAVSVNEEGMTLDKQCRQVENALSLDYNALSALYVEAFKEMRGLIEAQRAEIESLKSTVASLQSAVSQ